MKTDALSVNRFEPARSKFYKLYIWVWILLTIVYVATAMLEQQFTLSEIILSGLWISYGGFFVYAWFYTYYQLDQNQLYYRSGFSKGSIPLSSIYKVDKTAFAVGSMKAALSGDGLLIHYNKYDDLYVAPKNKEEFLQELLRLKPAIEVKEDLDQKTKAA